MTTLKEEVKKILDSVDNEIHREFFSSEFQQEYSKYDSDQQTEFKDMLKTAGLSVHHIANYGGEDCGSEYWSVYEFSLTNISKSYSVYVKFNGWYQSYNGSDYDEWFFAKAVPKSGFDYVKE